MSGSWNPKTISTHQVGFLTFLEDLSGVPLAHLLWQAADGVRRLSTLYESCSALAPDFYVFQRAPLDRLQQESALTACGTVGGKQYAATTDVYLDLDDRLRVLEQLLAHELDLLRTADPEMAVKKGEQPVPIYFPGMRRYEEQRRAERATENHPPPFEYRDKPAKP